MKEKKIIIFAIDDDPGDLEIFSRILEEIPGWDIEFNPFTKGKECVAQIAKRPMDVLFVDYYLGSTTAPEIISSLRKHNDNRPIIVLTGKGNEKIAAEITRAGANDYLVKGELTPDLLRRTISNTIEKVMADQEKAMLKKQLQEAQKMEAIGTLAGGIAHDFNNILFPIIGMAQMLLEDLPSGTPEWENVKEIETAGKRGAELVKQILAFSRQHEHQFSPTRFQFVMKEVLKLTRSSIPANIEITQTLQNDCGMVLADSTQLHQIGMNLITNAYHAVQDKGGRIDVEVREIEINENLDGLNLAPGRYAALKVADNGIGIKEAHLDRIFEPYFTTKEKGKGTGLGLSAVYGIVKEHGGEIKVKSTLGQGASFQIFIPVIVPFAESNNRPKGASLPTGTEHILLVDDEAPIARIEKQMLERLGYTVSTRTSSLEALEAFRNNPRLYDLVLSDMSMPQMTGDKLVEEILKIRSDIPIMICTGFSERITPEQTEKIGVKGFLMKPVTRIDLANEVRRILDEVKIHVVRI